MVKKKKYVVKLGVLYLDKHSVFGPRYGAAVFPTKERALTFRHLTVGWQGRVVRLVPKAKPLIAESQASLNRGLADAKAGRIVRGRDFTQEPLTLKDLAQELRGARANLPHATSEESAEQEYHGPTEPTELEKAAEKYENLRRIHGKTVRKLAKTREAITRIKAALAEETDTLANQAAQAELRAQEAEEKVAGLSAECGEWVSRCNHAVDIAESYRKGRDAWEEEACTDWARAKQAEEWLRLAMETGLSEVCEAKQRASNSKYEFGTRVKELAHECYQWQRRALEAEKRAADLEEDRRNAWLQHCSVYGGP